MFTGIIEALGTVLQIHPSQANITYRIGTALAAELRIDQSLAHDGVCLTVVAVGENWYEVTAIAETLHVTNLQQWKVGSLLNLERALLVGSRLDGHFVQGHVDAVGICTHITDEQGSWRYTIAIPPPFASLLISKGSVALNGISLTVVNPTLSTFEVTIIPYTFTHTNMQQLQVGDSVNLEFDVMGKYLLRFKDVLQSSTAIPAATDAPLPEIA